MANCNDLFIDFEEKISLSNTQKETLRISRDAIKDTIKNYFKSNDIKVPDFRQQGSFDMNTIINPNDIQKKRYDIDYGVYIQELPIAGTDNQKIETIKKWIFDAVKDQTDTPPLNMKKCVRVFYQRKYNIDLPIYKEENGISYIGTRDNGWQISDPAEFTSWFLDTIKSKGEQLRRLVKYLKAAIDYNNLDFKSIAATISVGINYIPSDKRDDESFVNTLKSIIANLKISRSIKKPVIPYENVLESKSQENINKLISDLENILNIANEAIILSDNERSEASLKWRKIFGDRFKEIKKNTESNSINSNVISNNSPKPWKS